MYLFIMLVAIAVILGNAAREGYFDNKKVSGIVQRLAFVVSSAVLGFLLAYGYFVFVSV